MASTQDIRSIRALAGCAQESESRPRGRSGGEAARSPRLGKSAHRRRGHNCRLGVAGRRQTRNNHKRERARVPPGCRHGTASSGTVSSGRMGLRHRGPDPARSFRLGKSTLFSIGNWRIPEHSRRTAGHRGLVAAGRGGFPATRPTRKTAGDGVTDGRLGKPENQREQWLGRVTARAGSARRRTALISTQKTTGDGRLGKPPARPHHCPRWFRQAT